MPLIPKRGDQDEIRGLAPPPIALPYKREMREGLPAAPPPPVAAHSMRSYVQHLRETGQLLEIERTVDPKFEIANIIQALDFGSYPVLFHHVKGYSMPVVAGLNGSRSRFAELLHTDNAGIVHKIIESLQKPLPYRIESTGPVKERRLTGYIDLLRLLPVPTWHEKDPAPFITAGMYIWRDAETGKHYTAILRSQIVGHNRFNLYTSSEHLLEQYAHLEAKGRPLEIAVAIGLDPLTMLASQVSFRRFKMDKFELAGALRGAPLELVRCDTIDLEVPAEAEIVLEGRVLPGIRTAEGPFGELGKYYGGVSQRPVVEVTAITHRESPIFQVILP